MLQITLQNSWKRLGNANFEGNTESINSIAEELADVHIVLDLLNMETIDMIGLKILMNKIKGYEYIITENIILQSIEEHKAEVRNNEHDNKIENRLQENNILINHSNAINFISKYTIYAENNPLISRDSFKFLNKLLSITENCRLAELQQKKNYKFIKNN